VFDFNFLIHTALPTDAQWHHSSAPTSQRTLSSSDTPTGYCFREIIGVYSDNHMDTYEYTDRVGKT
jgi:hypothetical protein